MKTRIALLTSAALLSGSLSATPVASAQGIPVAQSNKSCINGRAGFFPCKNVDLRSFLPSQEMDGGTTSDIWGWADPKTKREYALLGASNGLKFIDIS